MEEEVSSDEMLEFNYYLSENETISESENSNDNDDSSEDETEETTDVEGNIEDPKIGMVFDFVDEVHKYYAEYAKQNDFVVSKKSSKKDSDGEKKCVTIACVHYGKPNNRSSKAVSSRPQTNMGCKVAINVVRSNGKFMLSSFVLEHTHAMSPTKARYFKCNRVLESHI